MKKLYLFLTINCIICSIYCQGPEYNFERLSLKQGLIDQTINWIFQDHIGFIWIGGEHGLTRYDGYEFTFYKSLPGCNGCPILNRVWAIKEDNMGLLWISSDSGIWLYDPEKNRSMLVDSFVTDSTNWYFGNDRKMILDSKGNIWATDPQGLVKFTRQNIEPKANIKDLIYTHGINGIYSKELILSNEELGPGNIIRAVYEDLSGNIWSGCNEGLYVLRFGTNEFIRLDKGANKGTMESIRSINSILEINKNEYLILVPDGLYFMSIDNFILGDSIPDYSEIHFTFKRNTDKQWSVFMMADRKKNILTGTDKGIYKLNKDSSTGDIKFELLQNSYTDPEEIAATNSVVNIFEDRSGVLWAAYANGGIARFNLNQAQFTSYKRLINSNFNNPDINVIFNDNRGNLWIGCWAGGLYNINLENYKVKRFDFGFQKNDVVCMQEVSKGFFWIGSFRGIFTINSFTGKIADPLPDSKEARILRKSLIWDILRNEDLIYIGANSGLFIYNLTNKQLYSYEVRDYPNNMYCWSFIKSRSGEIWASTFEYGINKIELDPQNRVITLKSIISAKALTDNEINLGQRHRIYEDIKGNIWITDKFGLHQANIATGRVRNFKLFENIEFPDAWSITEDNHNNLWIGTRVGLCRFNIETERVNVFDKEDGLPISFHGINSVYKEKKGKLYFGGIGGFYSFEPDKLESNDSIPPIVITDFRLFNKSIKVDTSSSSILRKNISYTNAIQLRYNQNDISFQFAALDYNQPLKNKYSYILEGYQNEWVETDAKNRNATYTNLDPGTYTFRVKGSNNDGVWNKKGTSLIIIIHKPWWGTILAWIIYVVVFVGVTGGLIYRRLRKLKKEKIVLENQVNERTRQIEEQKGRILLQRDKLEEQNQKILELDELKSRFFTNISHEFRTPLSLIQSPVEELLYDPRRNEKERRKLNLIQRNTQRLLNLVNQLLDISKIDSSKMKLDLAEADVMKHLGAVAGSFSALAETKSIHYHLHFPKEELKTWFDPDKLEKIAVNLLSNAFKFTPEGGEVTFNASYKLSDNTKLSEILEFSVTDTGTGIPAASLEKVFDRFYQVESSLKKEGGGTGIGLSLARELARLMHGDITIKSEHCAGSTFYFQCPLGKNHLEESEFTLLRDLPESFALGQELCGEMVEESQEQNVKSSEKNPVLLIVEDNRDIRMHLADNFSQEFVIYEAIDGVSCLKRATELIPDLIITDLMMPRMDGIELCGKLKNDERTSHIPIIMLTAKVTTEDKISGLQTGADDYISKPFNMAELKTRVKNLIEQRKNLRERFSREITLEPMDISITPIDEKFLRRAIEIVEKHINEENYDLAEFRKDMNMSRSTLFRKLRALTGQSPTEFIRTIRLKRAASLLKQNFGNVTQVSLEVGFTNLSYFNRTFKRLFGVSPVEYTKSN